VVDVSSATVEMSIAMELSGPNVLPLDPQVQQNIVLAASNVWVGQFGMTAVAALEFREPGALAASAASAPAAAPTPAPGQAGGPRLLLQAGATGTVSVLLRVDVAAGQAPAAAAFVVASAANGTLATSFADQGGWAGGALGNRRWPKEVLAANGL
jgi:hypothetical protein